MSATTRQQKRAPVTLKIKFKSSTLEQFVQRYAVDISQGGIFIRTKSPLEVGTPLRFEFQLKDSTPLIGGEGTVVWTREFDPGRGGLAPGMGVRFDRLPSDSQQVLSQILGAKKALLAAPEPEDDFIDSPTRVAPRSVIEGLAEGSRDADGPVQFGGDEHTPMDAFDEATKVGFLEDLVAQTAAPDPESPPVTMAESEPITMAESEPFPPPIDNEPIFDVGAFDDAGDSASDAITNDGPVLTSALRTDLGTELGRSIPRSSPPPSFPQADDLGSSSLLGSSTLGGESGESSDFPEHVHTQISMSPPPPSAAVEFSSTTDNSTTIPALTPPSEQTVASLMTNEAGERAPKAQADRAQGAPSTQASTQANTRANDVALRLTPQTNQVQDNTPVNAGPVNAGPVNAGPMGAHAMEEDRTLVTSQPQHAQFTSSRTMWALLAAVVLVAAATGGWWLITQRATSNASHAADTDSVAATGLEIETALDETVNTGSAQNNTGSDNTTANNTTTSPQENTAALTVSAEITSDTDNAVATLLDDNGASTTQGGPAPLTLKELEKGKTYKIRLTAPGHISTDFEIVAGQPVKAMVLERKPLFLKLLSRPSGAAVYINRKRRGVTPLEFELKGTLATARSLTVEMKRRGFVSASRTLSLPTRKDRKEPGKSSRWSEEDSRITRRFSMRLERRQVVAPLPTNDDSTNGDDGDAKDNGVNGDGMKGDGMKGDGVKDNNDNTQPNPETSGDAGSPSGEKIPVEPGTDSANSKNTDTKPIQEEPKKNQDTSSPSQPQPEWADKSKDTKEKQEPPPAPSSP